MTEHTPGPWRVGADLVGICVDWRDESGNATKECFSRNGYVKTVARITHSPFADIEQHCANARLMAASPDLLTALISAEYWLTAALNCETWLWDGDQRECATADRDACRASIAKAARLT